MNYLIVYNNILSTDNDAIHETVTKHLGVADWWHYLPNTYIVTSTDSECTIANRIIARHPGLLFLIILVDPKHYNGVLDKRAWEWIDKKSRVLVKLKAVPQPPPDLLSGILGLAPIRSSPKKSFNDLLDNVVRRVK